MMERDKSDVHVYAMKGNMGRRFSRNVWEMGKPQKYGWVECGKPDAIEPIEVVEIKETEIEEVQTEEIKTVKIPDEKPEDVVEVVETEKEVQEVPKEKTREEMVKALNKLHADGKIPKPPHHLLGDVKLKKMYDENTK